MVYRIYTEKKPGLDHEAASLAAELKTFLGINGVERVRLLNRYDVEHIDRALFDYAVGTVFSEPQLDMTFSELNADGCEHIFAVEYLPGQFDQRADSAAQCTQMISQGERPTVRTARVYLLHGSITAAELEAIKKYVINPVESREAALDMPQTLAMRYDVPTGVETLCGFRALDADGLSAFISRYGLAMDADDIAFCQKYFIEEKRDPTITEIRMIDTYWSDHCRHTTFLTTIDSVQFEDGLLQAAFDRYIADRADIGRTKPVNLMDIATGAARYLSKKGMLPGLDQSEEINACTVKMTIDVDGEPQDWLLLFKNETHNHPTEIEPFGGAATCIGGAIRDPLSGRAYVYAAMRVTGAADPLRPVGETLPGKLPQRKLVTTAAAGYSSYGNQIGLATGQVDELYHDGYAAKRMEIGAVVGAAPAANVRRETPLPGDVVILLGGRTGRDGIGGATGSSKSHTLESLESCGAEVQKGNAPEERKLQRLFRSAEASRLIKRCNDFGAGGVSVAIGELADGLDIDLNRVTRKYEGLDGTELAISESQERMAVVVSEADAERFMALAGAENLEATIVARVTGTDRLVMRWNGKNIVDISRDFLNSNGAEKHISISPAAPGALSRPIPAGFAAGMSALAGDLGVCSRRGLSERFDSTIGAGTVLMPFGGSKQLTPIQAMAHKISLEEGHTDDCSLMAWGFNPYVSEQSPYHGAYLAVVESVCKLIATGASFDETYLTFQEYFEKPLRDPKRWGKPLAALLGAYMAQRDLSLAAIGGKDSMSGTFEHIDVPPTLVSFAVTHDKAENVISPEFKRAGSRVVLVKPEYDANGLPVPQSLLALIRRVTGLIRSGKVFAAYTPGFGGAAEAVLKMSLGNWIGFEYSAGLSMEELFGYCYGGFVLETDGSVDEGVELGYTCAEPYIAREGEKLELSSLLEVYEGKLESVYPCNIAQKAQDIPTLTYRAASHARAAVKIARPRVLIPVFPGTNCEYDSARAMRDAGAVPQIFVINNLTAAGIADSAARFADALDNSQIVFLPGGFSCGDEPDGSGKFITAFFRNARVKEHTTMLLEERGGLMCGICNGFQALIKLGLVPFGRIIDTDADCPTLTFNAIGRHQSRLVRTRVASNKSPWLMGVEPGTIATVPVSHGEGRFMASPEVLRALAENGQIATQYVDAEGAPTTDVHFNINSSDWAVEGITSPDGRVLGKMGHSERIGKNLYKNVPGLYDISIFASAVKYFG